LRIFVLLAVMLVLPLAFGPGVAADANNECFVDQAEPRICVQQTASPPDPRVPLSPTTVYVFLSGKDCLSPLNPLCHRVVYQETNGCPGLQRALTVGAVTCQPDKVLVA
jgi:hypothetical protein